MRKTHNNALSKGFLIYDNRLYVGELVGHSGILVAHCRRNFTHSNETTRSSSAMAWLLIIYILPLVGIIAYLAVGENSI